MPTDKSEVVGFRYDKITRKKWQELAEWENRSLNNMLIRLVNREHNRQKRRRARDGKNS